MDIAEIYSAALRAQAAYVMGEEGSRAVFTALGHDWWGIYNQGGIQAVASMKDGFGYVSISGTRFSDGQLEDLGDDLDLEPVDVGGGAVVTRGAYAGMSAMWQWATKILPRACAVWVCGHSLGAWRTYYTPLFLPSCRIAGLHCFESPKAANAQFWASYARMDTVSVVHEHDIFFGYPFVDGEGLCHPPNDHLWLHSGHIDVIDAASWPGGLSFEDHSIDLVVDALRALVP